MALNSVHPAYAKMLPDWEKTRDVYKGERHVKEQRTKYLPATQGMILDGFGKLSAATNTINPGEAAYEAYIMRAVMPDYFQDAVEVFMGLLHSQPPKIELPDALEPMRDKATQLGESLDQLLRRVNEEQLVTGRLGLLLDLPARPDPTKPMPYIAMYIAEAIINWDDAQIEEGEAKLNMVVLDESGYSRARNSFEWNWTNKHRVLELEPQYDEEGKLIGWGAYRQGVFSSDGDAPSEYNTSNMIAPAIRGTAKDEIPFVFVNTKDIVATPDKPSLMGLVNLCLTIYRGEADYRQNLFLQGQDTLVVVGDIKRAADPNQLAAADDGPLRTGTGAMIQLETGGTAEYIGVNSSGLPEQRTALENDRKQADAKSSALSTDSGGGGAESGEALKTRVGARTASLNSIAITGAGAVEWLLRAAARWVGADPEKVKVTPNMEFADYQMTGDMLNKLMTAKKLGAPLSYESIHALMAEGGVTKLSYEEEKEKLEEEPPEEPPAGTGAGGNPGDDEPPAAVA